MEKKYLEIRRYVNYYSKSKQKSTQKMYIKIHFDKKENLIASCMSKSCVSVKMSSNRGNNHKNKGGDNSGGNYNNHKSSSRKDSILELAKLVDSIVLVKCNGGRELRGTLRGYDELVNLVLDDCDEFLRGM